MKAISLVIFLFFISFSSGAQTRTGKGAYPLQQLRKTTSAFPHYVNFDVVKFMVPLNRDNSIGGTGFGFQFLWPYSLFKRKWYHSALGFTLGNNKKFFGEQKLNFSYKGVEIISDNQIQKTIQTRKYVGVTFLYCRRLTNSLTLLAGPSVQYNYSGKLSEKHVNPADNITFHNTSNIRKFSFPVSAQLSWSPLQAFPVGVFFSRDLCPVYKGENHNNIKQTLIGVSAAIIL